MPQFHKTLFLIQMKLLDAGLINAAQQAGEIAERKEDRDEKKKGVVDQAEDLAMDNKLKEFASKYLHETQDDVKEVNYTTRSIEQLRKEYSKRLLTQGKETTCPQCGANTKKIALFKSRFIYEGIRMSDTGEEEVELSLMGVKKKSRGVEREKSEMNPAELRDHFRSLYSTDHDLLRHLFPVMKRSDLKHPTDVLFLEVLPVPPPRARPCQFTGGIMTQHPQSQALQNVVESVAIIKPLVQVLQGKDISELGQEAQEMIKYEFSNLLSNILIIILNFRTLRGDSTTTQLDTVWKELQAHVDHVIDRLNIDFINVD